MNSFYNDKITYIPGDYKFLVEDRNLHDLYLNYEGRGMTTPIEQATEDLLEMTGLELAKLVGCPDNKLPSGGHFYFLNSGNIATGAHIYDLCFYVPREQGGYQQELFEMTVPFHTEFPGKLPHQYGNSSVWETRQWCREQVMDGYHREAVVHATGLADLCLDYYTERTYAEKTYPAHGTVKALDMRAYARAYAGFIFGRYFKFQPMKGAQNND